MKNRQIARYLITNLLVVIVSSGCQSFQATEEFGPIITLPFIKNSPEECYYLDEFMPAPDSMVPGRSGSLSLRYYTYSFANYKDWEKRHIVLSFYSNDDRCWSLFEEYYVAR